MIGAEHTQHFRVVGSFVGSWTRTWICINSHHSFFRIRNVCIPTHTPLKDRHGRNEAFILSVKSVKSLSEANIFATVWFNQMVRLPPPPPSVIQFLAISLRITLWWVCHLTSMGFSSSIKLDEIDRDEWRTLEGEVSASLATENEPVIMAQCSCSKKKPHQNPGEWKLGKFDVNVVEV